MGLSSDLISQFSKVVNNKTKTPTESTHFGTAVEYNGKMYVRLDGSDLLTPVFTTTDMDAGERVSVLIKNHSATVTGNLSSPSARTDAVKQIAGKVTEVEVLIADRVTTEQLEAEIGRIDTLVSDNVTIKDTLSANKAEIDSLIAADATINGRLTATEAEIDSLAANKIDADIVEATYATITELKATNADIYNLEATYGDFVTLTTNKFTAVEADIQDLDVSKLSASEARLTYAAITDLDAATAEITDLSATFADFEVATTDKLAATDAIIEDLQANKLSATDIEGKYANIDFSNISQATMEWFYANSGLIDNVVIGNGTIAGELVGVTIKGNLIEGGTVVADKLVIKGTDGLYYKLNTDGVTTESEQTEYNSLNGDIITAKSITASKISVEDLVAFGATIGGFHISDSSIYSGVKSSVDNTTNGVYLDNNGQIAFGNASQFVKFYKKSDGSYALDIAADSLSFGSSKTSVETVISGMQAETASVKSTATSAQNTANTAISNAANAQAIAQAAQADIDNLEIGGRNLLAGTSDEWINFSLNQWNGYIQPNNRIHYESLGLKPGDTITYSVEFKSTYKPIRARMDFYTNSSGEDGKNSQSSSVIIPVGESGVSYITRTIVEATPYIWFAAGSGDTTITTSTIEQYRCVKVEKGNTPTDWTPAPEDIEADVDALTTRVSTNETNISKNSEEIALRATKTEVAQSLSGYYTKEQTDSAISVKANEITSSVASTYSTKTEVSDAIDGIEVGGRNLLLGTGVQVTCPETDDFVSYRVTRAYVVSPIILNDPKAFLLALKDGRALSFSFDVDFPETKPDTSLDLTRIGCYFYVKLTRVSDGYVRYWYGTNTTNGPRVTHKHTWPNVNSLVVLDSEKSWIYHYSAYIVPSSENSLTDFYNNPDNYTVTFQHVYAEFRGFTKGGCIKNLKLELGNNPTDWTPAPEDVNSDIADVQSDVDDLKTTVETTYATKSEVSQTASEITSSVSATYATKSALATTNTNVSTAQAAADAAQSDIDNLDIGGRNYVVLGKLLSYIPYNTTPTANGEVITSTFNSTSTVRFFTLAAEVNPKADVYTLSGYIKVDGAIPSTKFILDYANTYGSKLIRNDYDATTGYFVITQTYPGTNGWILHALTNHVIGSSEVVTFEKLKFELGNKPTDWTPAPEDVAEDISTVQSNVDALQNTVVTTYATKSEVTQTANSITSSVSSTYATKSALASTDSNVAATKAELDNLEIGGRNLITGTSDEWGSISIGQWYGTPYRILMSDLVEKYGLKDGDVLTYSIYLKSSSGKNLRARWQKFNSNDDRTGNTSWVGIQNGEGLSSTIIVIDTSYTYLDLMITNNTATTITDTTTEYYRCLKLEKGTKPTDWTPAPEDVAKVDDVQATIEQMDTAIDERFTAAESIIEQLSDCISMLVVDANGTTLLEQTTEGWTFSLSDLNTSISNVSTDLAALQTSTGSTAETVSALEKAVDSLEETAEYVRIGTYESEPCIELGKSGSEFRLMITNTRIMFMKGDDIPTYIDTTGLVTQNITIEQELRQGNWVWKKRANGNYGLQWKEVTS